MELQVVKSSAVSAEVPGTVLAQIKGDKNEKKTSGEGPMKTIHFTNEHIEFGSLTG